MLIAGLLSLLKNENLFINVVRLAPGPTSTKVQSPYLSIIDLMLSENLTGFNI